MVEIGVDQLTDSPVDGEVGELLFSVVDIDLAQSFLLTAGGKDRDGDIPSTITSARSMEINRFFMCIFSFIDFGKRKGGMLFAYRPRVEI